MNVVSHLDNGRRLGRRASFVLLVCANVLMMANASAPSPIYPLYRERWGYSVTMLTVIFAVYVAGLLGALLTVGSLSDHLGRRPVLVAALLVAAASTAIFWTADGVGALEVARVVQGLATGTATGALAAGLVDFAPEKRPQLGPTMTAVGTSAGLAIGAGVVGLLVQVSTHPDAYVFPFLTMAFVSLAVVVLAIPERHTRRIGGLASLRPRVRVPGEARPEFLASVPSIVAGWSVTGLFLALAPSLVTTVLHVGFGAAGGLSIAVLFLANSAGSGWALRHPPRVATSLGAACLTVGSAGLAAALLLTSVVVFVIGSVVAGLGVGLTFTGTLRVISAATSAKARSEVFSAAYVVSYTALSVPALAAGLLARWWGLEATAYLYIGFVTVLSVIAAVHAGRAQAHRRTHDGRPATSAAGSRRHARHARNPC
ncbi:MFS transporter [Actinopolymorpha pittospori]|uniref:MFS family permease n=1 Tax=Actinopolymorpha pittospori TaxID=648752 RepID=A0A927RMM0_9ACTN|nr:MFS transporter [Actinopolymorpha pittospori]MBE1609078.1 MFS family permease [Actinopolymorpha pittospori]